MKTHTNSGGGRLRKDLAIYRDYQKLVAKGYLKTLVMEELCKKHECSTGHIYNVLRRVRKQQEEATL